MFRIIIPTLITLYSAACVPIVVELPINVVIIVIGDNPAIGYYVQAPAFDASFENLQLTYPKILAKVNRHMIHKPGNFTCIEAAALMNSAAGEAYKMILPLSGTIILISPGCNLEITVLGDFARGLYVYLNRETMNYFSIIGHFWKLMEHFCVTEWNVSLLSS